MIEEREEVYQILELGKHLKNLHHKKGFGGLLFIDLSMIKFSKLSSYIRQLDKENKELKEQLHNASIQIQELIEKDIWCPSNCEKLEKLEQENKQLQEELEWAIGIVEHNRIISEKNKEIHQLKDSWNKLKEWLKEYEEGTYGLGSYETGLSDGLGDVIKKMQELEGSRE